MKWLSRLNPRSKKKIDDPKNYETQESPTPSLPAMTGNELPAPDGQRTVPQTAGETYSPSPNLSGSLHGVGNSITSGDRGFNSTTNGGAGETPGVDRMVRDNTSGTNLSVPFSDRAAPAPAPGFSAGITPQNPSEPAIEASGGAPDADPMEFVGISLVGRKFRDLNMPA